VGRGTRDDVAGSWLIEESELHRVFPPGTAVPGTADSNDAPRTPDRTAELETRIAEMQESARLRDDTIADLRRRLDTATAQLGEALTQVRLLTDQRAKSEPAAAPPPRRRWWRLILAAALLAGYGPSLCLAAEDGSVDELLSYCVQPPGTYGSGYCLGYVNGIASAATGIYCLPKGVTRGQTEDVVVRYLQSHPEIRYYAANLWTQMALAQAFPCKR
jgi:uncharacterized coiled-coil protein SlyX